MSDKIKHIYILIISLCLVMTLLMPGCNYSKSEPTPSTTVFVPNISEKPPVRYKAPIDVSALSDGQTVRVNLVRFTGKIPSPSTIVLVNGSSVTTDNGNYYIYLDLLRGQNVIEVKTITDTETKADNIHVFFEPPLAVHLYLPNFDSKENYLENPLILVNGDVSNPSAKVEVNGIAQEVHQDGTFTAEVISVKGGNTVMAVATVGEETDIYTLAWLISNNGQHGVVPGYSKGYPSSPYNNDYLTYLITKNQTVNIKSGEATNLDFGISIGKAHPTSITASVEIRRTDNQTAMLPSLKINVEPSSYTVYPKIQYYSRVVIKAEPSLMPRYYYYVINYSDLTTSAISMELTIRVN